MDCWALEKELLVQTAALETDDNLEVLAGTVNVEVTNIGMPESETGCCLGGVSEEFEELAETEVGAGAELESPGRIGSSRDKLEVVVAIVSIEPAPLEADFCGWADESNGCI